VARLVPKPCINVESTGPNVFRYVDAHKPTLIIDEADDVFTRKSDLKHIINASWTRGTKIPRQVKIDDVFVTVFFDPFCPKALGLLGGNLPRTLRTRSIEIRMVPKRPDETVEPFEHTDDFEFAVLRRQLARFAADNAKDLKTRRRQDHAAGGCCAARRLRHPPDFAAPYPAQELRSARLQDFAIHGCVRSVFA
jgi:hypothetical protein